MTLRDYSLCPCGSGLAFKTCCGADAGDVIGRSRRAAYAGEVGRAREAFCRDYTARKQSAIAGICEGLKREAGSTGKLISCARGCTPCCRVYVVASLQECEAVVYYLYSHEEVLRRFLRAYAPWRRGIDSMRDTFFNISRLQQKRMSHRDSPEDDSAFNAELVKYSEHDLSCPFLFEGACSIYEVRPYVCASVVSVSPAEWCELKHPEHYEMSYIKTQLNLGKDMPYFVRPTSGLLFANMPQLVHDILSDGYGALSAIPGLEGLQPEVLSDPEVLDALRRLR